MAHLGHGQGGGGHPPGRPRGIHVLRVLALFVFSRLAWFARAGGEGASARRVAVGAVRAGAADLVAAVSPRKFFFTQKDVEAFSISTRRVQSSAQFCVCTASSARSRASPPCLSRFEQSLVVAARGRSLPHQRSLGALGRDPTHHGSGWVSPVLVPGEGDSPRPGPKFYPS